MTEELKQKVLEYLETVTKAKNREVARALGEDKGVVDKAIADLAKKTRSSISTWGPRSSS